MKLLWTAVLAFAVAPLLAHAEPRDLQVTEFACARSIANRMPVTPIDCGAFHLPGPAYLWVRLRGGPIALAWLESGKEIAIRHKWVRYVGPSLQVETIEAEEDISVGSIDPSLLSRLRGEVRARGYFDWRTWSAKSRLRTTRYSVTILDPEFTEILCESSVGETTRCSLQVSIRGMQ